MAAKRGRRKKVKCEDCYFRCNMLCALNLAEPCPTFRPNGPDGLKPPQQLSFFIRDNRAPTLYAFKSPN